MVAARISNMKGGSVSKKSGPIGPVSKVHAAKLLNVGRMTDSRARQVLAKGTKSLVSAVADGKIVVSVAAKLADTDEATQDEGVANPGRAAQIVKRKKARAGQEAPKRTNWCSFPGPAGRSRRRPCPRGCSVMGLLASPSPLHCLWSMGGGAP